MTEKALSSLRVLDFTWVGAGALTTRTLAEHGADVIKIESSTHIDSLRTGPPFASGRPGINRSGYFAERNANKRSVTIDLKTDKGLQLVRELAKSADIIANNFRPGVMERLGIGYEEMSAINPSVIYLTMSMQGSNGPESAYLGYGITIAALAGITYLSAEPGRYPVGTGTHYPDHVPNPSHAVFAVLAALRHRRRTGQGQLIEVAQTEPTVAAIGPAIMEWTANQVEASPIGNRHPVWSPHGLYPCRGEDRWIAIAARSDAEWSALVRALDLEAPPEWDDESVRRRSADEVDSCLANATKQWDVQELVGILQGAGLPAGAVQNAQDLIVDDPQLRHREHWRYLEHPEMGRSLYGVSPFRLSSTPGELSRAAPLLGEHTDEVLRDVLGLSTESIAELSASGVLR